MKKITPPNTFDGKFPIGKIVVNICTVILTVTLILFLFNGISNIRDMDNDYNSDYYSDENYLTQMSEQDYINLFNIACRDCNFEKDFTPTVLECKAVAHYYEAAVLYQSFLKLNDTEHAKEQAGRMEYYADQLDTYKDQIEKINTLLDLQAPS